MATMDLEAIPRDSGLPESALNATTLSHTTYSPSGGYKAPYKFESNSPENSKLHFAIGAVVGGVAAGAAVVTTAVIAGIVAGSIGAQVVLMTGLAVAGWQVFKSLTKE